MFLHINRSMAWLFARSALVKRLGLHLRSFGISIVLACWLAIAAVACQGPGQVIPTPTGRASSDRKGCHRCGDVHGRASSDREGCHRCGDIHGRASSDREGCHRCGDIHDRASSDREGCHR